MPKKIPPDEMRRWLEMYDAGKSEVSIAREAHRDARTVKNCIKKARQERRVNAAQIELLKNALTQHQDSLLRLICDLRDRIFIPDLSITLSDSEQPVSFGIEDEVKWELLQEHLKGDRLLTDLTVWNKAFSEHISARAALKMKCVKKLKTKLCLPIVDEPISEPFIYSSTTPELLYETTVRRIIGKGKRTRPEERITVVRQRGEVKLGPGTTLVWAPGKEEECREKLIATFEEIMKESEIARFRRSYSEIEEAGQKAKRSLEEINLLGFISGECRVCRRLVR